MEFKDINLRFSDLSIGDMVVAKLVDGAGWNQTGVVLAVYQDGHLYDAWCKEDNLMPKEDWCLTNREVEGGVFENFVKEYSFTGVNVVDNVSPVLD